MESGKWGQIFLLPTIHCLLPRSVIIPGKGGSQRARRRQGRLGAGLQRLLAIAEAYPDLKASASYLDLMREYARQQGLRRWIVPVPVLTPWLSSLWLGLVTPLYARVGRALIEGVRNPTVVRDDAALRPLADAATCRSEADWLVGINGTRAMTAFNSKTGGFHQHYGKDNAVRNNVFAFATDHQLQRSREEPHVSFSFSNNIVLFDHGVLLGSTWKTWHAWSGFCTAW